MGSILSAFIDYRGSNVESNWGNITGKIRSDEVSSRATKKLG